MDLIDELAALVETLTTSGSRTLNQNLFKRVKAICKSSDENVKHLYRFVMTQLEKSHSEIRLSSLQIINEIFMRSHAFRVMLVDDFQRFLSLTLAVNSKTPLPQPNAVANILRSETFKAIESWHQKYGVHYIKLALGYKYLKRVKKFNFDGFQPRTALEQQMAQDAEMRQRYLAEQKLTSVLTQMADSLDEIRNIITEVGNCCRLVLPSPDEFDVYGTTVVEETSSPTSSKTPCDQHNSTISDEQTIGNGALNGHGVVSPSFQLSIPFTKSITIIETSDNADVLTTLREHRKQIAEKYLPMTQKWLEVLTKHSGHHDNLVQAIDLKNSLTEIKYKLSKLKTVSNKDDENGQFKGSVGHFVGDDGSDDADDDQNVGEFIDVPEKEGIEYISDCLKQTSGLKQVQNYKNFQTPEKIAWNPQGDAASLGDPSSRATAIAAFVQRQTAEPGLFNKDTRSRAECNHSETGSTGTAPSTSSLTDKKRAELLKKAPIVPFDMDLYNWERNEDEAPSVSTITSLHCFWQHGSEDTDGHCPGDIRESLKTRSIPFAGKFEEVKWACRAILPSGKLCPRKDRCKCPFHGKIIPRDEMGRPIGNTEDDDELGREKRIQDDDDVRRDIELATGMDLGGKAQKKGKKRKHSGLCDLKNKSNTSRARLEKIVFNKAALERIAEESDRVQKSLIDNKFGNNWNYALSK